MKTKQTYVTWILTALLFILKTKDFYEDIANDVEKWFNSTNYDECNSIENDKRPLPVGKNKKVIGLFKDELGGKIMIEFVGLTAEFIYILNDWW